MLRVEVVLEGCILKQLTRIGDALMALKDEFTALVTALDTATNQVATQLAKMQTEITGLLANPNSITNDDKVAVEATFQTQIDRLTTMGKDPENPIPPVPPEVS